MGDFPEPPEDWTAAVDAVQAVVEREHGADARKRTADEQSRVMGKLIGSGQVAGDLVVARRS